MDCGCGNAKREKTCIEIVPIFNTLTYDEMLEIASITNSRKYEKGEMIYTAGDKGEKLYVIHKGKVKITRFSEMGKEQIIRVLEPGDFMGELSLFAPSPLTDNAEALRDTSICIIDGNNLKELLEKYPSIGLKLLEELSSRLGKAENLIENLGIHDVETRIVKTILDLANDQGKVLLKMSKGDLASHIGMSQETLSRKLSYLQEMGWIRLEGHRRIIVLDKESLQELI